MKNTIDLERRSASIGPIFVASYNFGDKIDNWEPEVGNSVSLHSGSITVLARITSASSRKYIGKIVGFEGYDDYEFNGLKPEDELEFNYDNVFSVSR